MPININGSTDTTGAVSVMPLESKSVCILAKAGAGTPTATVNTLFTISSTVDAASKFGDNADVVDFVKILINNKVADIKGVLVTGAVEADAYDAGLDALLKEIGVDIIVVDSTDATVTAKVLTHLDLAEGEGLRRYAVVGAGATVVDSAGFSTLAGTLNHPRIFLPGLHLLDESGATLSGKFAAVGLAAAIAVNSDDPALPLNSVKIYGFGGAKTALLKSERDALVAAGVTPLMMDNGSLVIYRLVTTKTKDGEVTDLTWQEGTTIFTADYVLDAVSNRLRNNYKRTKNVARILKAIRGDVIDVLGRCQDLEIIENLNADLVSVIKDPNDAYGALIDYSIDIVTPLYTITINQHMSL